MAKLIGIELLELKIPFSRPIGTSTTVFESRTLILLRSVTDVGEGWGECAALDSGTVVDPSASELMNLMKSTGIPAFFQQLKNDNGLVPEPCDVAYGPAATLIRNGLGRSEKSGVKANMLIATFEMSFADLIYRERNISLASALGVQRTSVDVGGMIGLAPAHDLGWLGANVDELVASGIARLRLKIAPGWDVEPTCFVRERYPELSLQVDANGAYQLESFGLDYAPSALLPLDSFGLRCIEQPLFANDISGHGRLAELLDTPICLDETLTSLERLREAIEVGACQVACLKPARLGGLFATRSILEECSSHGIDAFVGGFYEAGQARSANLSLAGLDGFTMPGDLTSPSQYLEDDPFHYSIGPGAQADILLTPGIGPPPNLDCWVESREWIEFDL